LSHSERRKRKKALYFLFYTEKPGIIMCRNTKNGKVYNTKRIDEDDRTEIDNYSNSDI